MLGDKQPKPEDATEAAAQPSEETAADVEITDADNGPTLVFDNSANDARISELEAEVAELKDRLMRAMADTENTRRRADRDKQDALKYAVTNFARDMVSVADNFGRALSAIPDEARSNDAVKNVLTGIEMTERELQSAFERHGIKKIEAFGKRFDHNFHQAVFEVNDPTQPSGMVAQVMQEGYIIHDRLLRPSMVGVSKGGPKPEDVAPAAAEAGANPDDAKRYENDGAKPAGSEIDQES